MSRISEETIQKVGAANDIVEVIGGYLPLKKAGSAFRALCPFHREKTPSFHVNPQRQIFHCFGCGAGGSVFRFVMTYENIDFVAAVRKLAARAGIPIIEDAGAQDDRADLRAQLMRVHAEAALWFHENLLKREFAAGAREYLKGRGITKEVAVSWQIGYAPDEVSALQAWAQERRIERPLLIAAGLVKEREEGKPAAGVYDKFRDRVMFPVCNDSGAPIAFSGRTLKSDPRVPKYLNSPETAIFTKGRILFGLHKSKRAIIDADEAVVLEGQIDLISCFEGGLCNVVAPQGTAFTPDQARILKRYAGGVVLCFDSDNAGRNAAEKSFPALLEANLAVKVARLPEGDDPDSLVRTRGAEALRSLVKEAEDYFAFLIRHSTQGEDLREARVKLAVAERLAGAISLVSDPVLRDDALTRSAAALGISAAELRKKLKEPHRGRPEDVELSAAPARLRPPEAVHILCLLALHSSQAREWLRGQAWPEIVEELPEAAPLGIILSRLTSAEENAVAVFVATQEDKAIESYFATLLNGRAPVDCASVVQEWWRRFALQARLRKKARIAESLARAAPPDWAAIGAAKKEVLDLQLQLNQLDPL